MRLIDIGNALNLAWYGFSFIALVVSVMVLLRSKNDPAQKKLHTEALVVLGMVVFFCLLPFVVSFIRK